MRTLVLGCVLLWISPNAVLAATMTFDFDSGPDPDFFSVFNDSGGLMSVDTDGPTIRISKDADDGQIKPLDFLFAGIESKFSLIGDFTATVDFTLHNLPPTSTNRLNESLFASFDGNGNFFEILRFKSGSADLIEVFTVPGGPIGAQPSTLIAGHYRLTRVGSLFTGSVASSGSSSFTSIGSKDISTDPFFLEVFAAQGREIVGISRSTTAIDISFDNLVVVADGIIPEPSSFFLVTIGLFALAGVSRRRR